MIKLSEKLYPRTSKDLRIFAGMLANLNSRCLIEHLDSQLSGVEQYKASQMCRIIYNFEGECFTNSFDVRTYNMPPQMKAARKLKRMARVLLTETKDEVNLKENHRRKFMIHRRLKYGSLIGKNAYANLTMIVKTGGMKIEPGVLAGPGAESGFRFISGQSLGCGTAPTTQGLLADMFDQTVAQYKTLRTRWKKIADRYLEFASAARHSDEAAFWSRMAARVSFWRKCDDVRTQFRCCEFSKIGGIVCRNQGRWRATTTATEDHECEEEQQDDDVAEFYVDPASQVLEGITKLEEGE